MANDTDQPDMWTNQNKGSYEALDSATVIIDTLTEPDAWENTPADISNSYQD